MATTIKSSSLEKTDNKEILGQGGYGIVYKDIWNGRKVAVKRIQQFRTTNNEREEDAMHKLDHRNVAKLFYVENNEYFKYYVLELCEASLEKLFLKDDDPQKYRGPMPSENQVFLQLAKGLAHIHDMELSHQDIKPQNVHIYVRSDRKKVTMKWADFGLCQPVNERGTCSMSEVSGTLNWLAPEILKLLVEDNLTENDENKRGTVKSDVFAEGLVFGYYLFRGQHPYGPNIEVMQNILGNNPVNLNGITERRPIHDIMTEMLKTNPHERISSSDVVIKIKTMMDEEGKMATDINSTSLKMTKDKEILGQGRYGTVYEDTWNGRKVAVKRIPLTHISSNEREKEALKKLDNPNVVKLFHVDKDENFKYYALEFCQASLEKRFLKDEDPKKYRGPMPSENQVFLQLAKGLAYIHDMELIHRDIKPQNVLIYVQSDRNEVTMKWADFGLSRPVNERGTFTMSGVRGTEHWFAPEILDIYIRNEDIGNSTPPHRGTIKSDVFAEGLVFGYYLLGGKHPYGQKLEITQNILGNNPVNLKEITKRQPIHDIITEMLKTNPHERISSFGVVFKITTRYQFL